MVIIRMQGGLGNQLFQYALCWEFKSKGIETKIDISAYEDGREGRKLELKKLGLDLETADRQELHCYFADNALYTDRFFRYLFGRGKYKKEKDYDFNPSILDIEDGFLSGYWQSEKYFRTAASEVRERICFQNIDIPSVKQREEQIEGVNAVSIHVRQGDYLQHAELYGGICTEVYYRKAIQYMAEHVKDPVFFVFSDEPDRAQQMLAGYSCHVVTENMGDNSYRDMYLMSRCRHHIIANSTFSWWGAWLDRHEDKIVITPPKWNHLCKTHDICCDDWIMIESVEE